MGIYSMSQLYLMIAVSTAIITLPGIAMGTYWWGSNRKRRHPTDQSADLRAKSHETPPRLPDSWAA